jgi:hypothetical protein
MDFQQLSIILNDIENMNFQWLQKLSSSLNDFSNYLENQKKIIWKLEKDQIDWIKKSQWELEKSIDSQKHDIKEYFSENEKTTLDIIDKQKKDSNVIIISLEKKLAKDIDSYKNTIDELIMNSEMSNVDQNKKINQAIVENKNLATILNQTLETHIEQRNIDSKEWQKKSMELLTKITNDKFTEQDTKLAEYLSDYKKIKKEMEDQYWDHKKNTEELLSVLEKSIHKNKWLIYGLFVVVMLLIAFVIYTFYYK